MRRVLFGAPCVRGAARYSFPIILFIFLLAFFSIPPSPPGIEPSILSNERNNNRRNETQTGDLHPGNILVEEDPEDGRLCLKLLDCGLVVEMGPEQHVNLVKILGAFVRRQGRVAGQLMVDTSSNRQASPEDVELFVRGIERIVIEDEDNNFVEKVGDYITDICYLACRRKVKLEASFISAALAVEIMEGIATALDPNLIVTKTALPMILQAEVMHRLPKFSLW